MLFLNYNCFRNNNNYRVYIGADYRRLWVDQCSRFHRHTKNYKVYRPNKSCLNNADEDGASPELPADTESNYGNNNSHDSDNEILLDNE